MAPKFPDLSFLQFCPFFWEVSTVMFECGADLPPGRQVGSVNRVFHVQFKFKFLTLILNCLVFRGTYKRIELKGELLRRKMNKKRERKQNIINFKQQIHPLLGPKKWLTKTGQFAPQTVGQY